MRAICFTIIYLVGAVVTYGATNANRQYECHHHLTHTCDARMVREDQGFAAVMAVVPPFWASVLIMTGLYADGISFSATPHI